MTTSCAKRAALTEADMQPGLTIHFEISPGTCDEWLVTGKREPGTVLSPGPCWAIAQINVPMLSHPVTGAALGAEPFSGAVMKVYAKNLSGFHQRG